MDRLSFFEYCQRTNRAKTWASRIIQFPFVRKVSLTGSMATGQATAHSDIDLFIQVEEGNLWWVRLAITIWVHLVGERRTARVIANKLCLNWFATFDGPATQSRRHIVLASRDADEVSRQSLRSIKSKFQNPKIKKNPNSKISNDLELLIKPFSPLLEFTARNIQRHRFINDARTLLPGSQVRFSNVELGFHPPKIVSSHEVLS